MTELERLAIAAQSPPGGGSEGWEGVVRAILTAMREPSGAMCEAAILTAVRENKGIEYAPYQGWQAMLDHILSGGE